MGWSRTQAAPRIGIAAQLGIEDKTVEYHVTQILGKLGIEPIGADHRRVLAVIAWLRRGD